MSIDDLKVIPRREFWRDVMKVSERTGDRLEAARDCPIKTQISANRVGFRVDHIKIWLDARKQRVA